ncbi:MAG: virulence factor [Caldimonas sp.]
MATFQVTYWQEIPSQVDAREGRDKPHKEMLGMRFQELIDIVASARKMGDADAYISGWNKGPKETRDGSASEVGKAVAAEFEARFDAIRSEALQKTKSGEGSA